jgi:hypothetical protein
MHGPINVKFVKEMFGGDIYIYEGYKVSVGVYFVLESKSATICCVSESYN